MKYIKYTAYTLLAIVLFLVVDVGRYALYPDVSELVNKNPIPTAFMEYRKEQWADEGKQKGD